MTVGREIPNRRAIRGEALRGRGRVPGPQTASRAKWAMPNPTSAMAATTHGID